MVVFIIAQLLVNSAIPDLINTPDLEMPPPPDKIESFAVGLIIVVQGIVWTICWFAWTPLRGTQRGAKRIVPLGEETQTKLESKSPGQH